MSAVKIIVYGFEGCPYCSKAVNALLLSEYEFDYIKIPEREDRKRFMDERGFPPQDRTFPRCYYIVNEEETENLIGGSFDLIKWLEDHPTWQ